MPCSLVVHPYCVPFRYTVAKSITLLSVDTTLPDSDVRGCAKREAE